MYCPGLGVTYLIVVTIFKGFTNQLVREDRLVYSSWQKIIVCSPDWCVSIGQAFF